MSHSTLRLELYLPTRVVEQLERRADELHLTLEQYLRDEILHVELYLHLTHRVTNVFTGDTPMSVNTLVFTAAGQISTDTITPYLTDGVTPSGGVVSNVVVTFADPSAKFVINPDNTVTFTAVADTVGGLPVDGKTAFTVTDTDGAVSQWKVSFAVLVNILTPPPPTQLTQSVANVFSTPA